MSLLRNATVTLIAAGILAACTGKNPAMSQSLTVFAAASLTEAFTRLSSEFTARHAGVEIFFNFAGSQQLAQQIAQEAPADVFASADEESIQAIIDNGQAEAGSEHIFASNRLVLVCAPGNPGGILEFKDLAKPGLRLLLAAENVPAGRYSRQALVEAARLTGYPPEFESQVLEQVVSLEDSVRAVLTKVSLGEADAGIVYRSDLNSAAAAGLQAVEIPEQANPAVLYPISVLRDSQNPVLAREFVDFVLSSQGQEILKEYGFGRPPG